MEAAISGGRDRHAGHLARELVEVVGQGGKVERAVGGECQDRVTAASCLGEDALARGDGGPAGQHHVRPVAAAIRRHVGVAIAEVGSVVVGARDDVVGVRRVDDDVLLVLGVPARSTVREPECRIGDDDIVLRRAQRRVERCIPRERFEPAARDEGLGPGDRMLTGVLLEVECVAKLAGLPSAGVVRGRGLEPVMTAGCTHTGHAERAGADQRQGNDEPKPTKQAVYIAAHHRWTLQADELIGTDWGRSRGRP